MFNINTLMLAIVVTMVMLGIHSISEYFLNGV